MFFQHRQHLLSNYYHLFTTKEAKFLYEAFWYMQQCATLRLDKHLREFQVAALTLLVAAANAGLLSAPVAYSAPAVAAPYAYSAPAVVAAAPVAVKAALPVATSYQNTYKVSRSWKIILWKVSGLQGNSLQDLAERHMFIQNKSEFLSWNENNFIVIALLVCQTSK